MLKHQQPSPPMIYALIRFKNRFAIAERYSGKGDRPKLFGERRTTNSRTEAMAWFHFPLFNIHTANKEMKVLIRISIQ